jgi:hypothetical protein
MVNVSAGDICTDDGNGTIAWIGRAAATATGAVTGGDRRPHAVAVNATASIIARVIAELRPTMSTSVSLIRYFGVSPAASYNTFDS